MKRWLAIAGVVMLFAWAPFFYAELTSSPSEKKTRALPTDEPSEAVPAAEPNPAAEATPAQPAPSAKPPEAPEPVKPAEPDKPAAAPAKPAPSAPAPVAAADKAQEANPADGEPAVEEAEEEAPTPPPAAGPTAVLKHAFETQPRDPLWSADTEAHVKGLFRGGDVPAELLQSASCRTSVCRLELRWTKERATAYVSLYESVHRDFQGEVGVEPIGAPDDHGQEQVNLYLTRKGYTVADLSR